MEQTGKRDCRDQDARLLTRFIQVYCEQRHGTKGPRLCESCADLLAYSRQRLERCPYDPKPRCKDCPTHCYRPAYRERIREVMKFSGIYFVKRGRLDWLLKYFF